MIDDLRTIGNLVSELRQAKELGVSVDRLRAAGIASPQALIVDMGARGYKLELARGGAGDRPAIRAAPCRGGVEAQAGAALRYQAAGAV